MRKAPLLLFIFFLVALALSLGHTFYKIGESDRVPQLSAFDVPMLGKPGAHFTPALWKGRPIILNVFASWCAPCAAENPLLMELAKSGKVQIYGLAWKDKPERIAAWLKKNGNPYKAVGVDTAGDTTIPLGLTGVPETMEIDAAGNVLAHYKMPLTQELIDTRIAPDGDWNQKK